MIKITVYVDSLDELKQAVLDVAAFRKAQNLYLWELKSDDDSEYTVSGKPGNFTLQATLVTQQEADNLLARDRELDRQRTQKGNSFEEAPF